MPYGVIGWERINRFETPVSRSVTYTHATITAQKMYRLKTDRNVPKAPSFPDRLPVLPTLSVAMTALSVESSSFPTLRLSLFIFSSSWPRRSLGEGPD